MPKIAYLTKQFKGPALALIQGRIVFTRIAIVERSLLSKPPHERRGRWKVYILKNVIQKSQKIRMNI